MDYIIRNTSVITGKANLEPLYTYRNFPVFIGCTDRSPQEDLRADMSFAICKDTGIIQLDKVLPLEVVYSGYHSEALGGVWGEHHQHFVDFIHAYAPTHILEIGGSNGVLAKQFFQSYGITPWSMVEPNPSPSLKHEKDIMVIEKMFDRTFQFTGIVDTLVHSHVLEHMYEPRQFFEAVARFLPMGAQHIFSVPNLYQYLKNKQANSLNFEHTVFLTEYMIDYLLSQYGFAIEEKKYFRDHSIMYATRKEAQAIPFDLQSKYQEYKALFSGYTHSMQAEVERLNTRMMGHAGPVYLFGAHVFSQLLLQIGLHAEPIVAIVDNSLLKQGKRLYGTNLVVQSLESIKDQHDVAVLLKAGVYQEEVRNQLLQINPHVVILE